MPDMRNLFVSSQDVDDPKIEALIGKLRSAGFQVSHSPRNPLSGRDDRWPTWYAIGLPEEIEKAQSVIVGLDPHWESCWMLVEAEEARLGLEKGGIQQIYYYNPYDVQIQNPATWRNYLRVALPNDVDAAVQTLLSRAGLPAV